jgi:hypothetical protein
MVVAPAAHAAERPHFHECRDAAAEARCGYVRVPLDRLDPAGEKIRIGFELYRRRDRSQPALGTLVDVEGGPGYSTTDSRDYFLGLSRPLMNRRDLLRWQLNYGGTSRGLRGGRWSWSGDKLTRFRFRGTRFVGDIAVNGTATWRLRTGQVRADLTVPNHGRLRVHWSVLRPLAVATLTGRIDGRRLRATMPAP